MIQQYLIRTCFCCQFYSKLEEKQAAMEAERLENEARIKVSVQSILFWHQ